MNHVEKDESRRKKGDLKTRRPIRHATNHSEPLRTTQNHSEPLRIATKEIGSLHQTIPNHVRCSMNRITEVKFSPVKTKTLVLELLTALRIFKLKETGRSIF